MEQELQDLSHYARIIAGCESINYVLSGNGHLTEDGRYAQSVLKLRAQDEFGALAGNESLLEGVKKGARKLKEWILSLVAAIKNFLTGAGKQKKDMQTRYNEIKAAHSKATPEAKSKVEEKWNPALKPYAEVFTRIVDKLKNASPETLKPSFEALGFSPDTERAVDLMQQAIKDCQNEADFFSLYDKVMRASGHVEEMMLKAQSRMTVASAKADDNPELSKHVSKIASWLNTVAAVNHSMIMNAKSLATKQRAWLDEYMTA